MVPTPAPQRYIAIGEPRPPTPTIRTFACRSNVCPFSPLSKEEIFSFIKITHNSRYSFKYTWFFIEFIRCLLEYEDKEQALQQAEQRCDVEVNRQNLCNGSFVVDTVESVVNWFMAGNSYKECVFSAINSGKSSDAVGALTGLLAGIYYGLELKNGVKGFETMGTIKYFV